MNKITKQHFRVDNFDGLKEFYVDILGMDDFSTKEYKMFGFNNGCHLCFHKKDVKPYVPTSNDFYWKIGITLKNLDIAIQYLQDKNLNPSIAGQFKDIGYMSKITDPKGFSIELLQQGFIGNEEKISNNGHKIASQATLAHITLRVSDLKKSEKYFGTTHNMRLMSIQSVQEYGFCLYFYSFSKEILPNKDLKSVENRQWLWRRDYTFIELQHLEFKNASLNKTSLDVAGFDGFSYVSDIGDEVYVSYSCLVDNVL